MTHNVYEGRPSIPGTSRNQPLTELIDAYFYWLQRLRVDIIVLNELNGWIIADAKSSAEKFGFNLELLATNHGFDIGIASKKNLNFTVIAKETEGWHHGLLHVFFDETAIGDEGLHVLATHLSPHSSAIRRREASKICALVARLNGAHAVLAGDLNTLAPSDNERIKPFLAMFQQNERLSRKFLTTSMNELGIGEVLISDDASTSAVEIQSASSRIDFEPMKLLLGCLQDMALNDGDSGPPPGPTVPTNLQEDAMHAAPMRLDYILATPALADNWRSKGLRAVTATESGVADISDHFPVILREDGPMDLDGTFPAFMN